MVRYSFILVPVLLVDRSTLAAGCMRDCIPLGQFRKRPDVPLLRTGLMEPALHLFKVQRVIVGVDLAEDLPRVCPHPDHDVGHRRVMSLVEEWLMPHDLRQAGGGFRQHLAAKPQEFFQCVALLRRSLLNLRQGPRQPIRLLRVIRKSLNVRPPALQGRCRGQGQ